MLVGAEPQPWSPGQRAFLQSKVVVDVTELEVAELVLVLMVVLVGAEPQP